mgnify:CR=1 FL=1
MCVIKKRVDSWMLTVVLQKIVPFAYVCMNVVVGNAN